VTKKIPINKTILILENVSKLVTETSKKIEFKFNVPKHPYIKEAPNKKNPEKKDPDIKYFNPASVEKEEFLLKAAKI